MSPTGSARRSQIYRHEKLLLIERGADLSHACLVCGKATAGPPIERHLSAAHCASRKGIMQSSWLMLLWDLLALVLSAVWWLFDWRARRERVILFGLCARHRKKYVLCRWSAWIGGIAGRAASAGRIL